MALTVDQKRALLEPYQIDLSRAFLPSEDPLEHVPDELGPWCGIADQLPKLLIAGKLRQAVNEVSKSTIASVDKFIDKIAPKTPAIDCPALERSMLAFSYIGQAYIWGERVPPKSLPVQLAVPWHKIARKLGRHPILSYATYSTQNWKRIDKNAPVELGNIALVQDFLGGADEEWFVLVHVELEGKAGGAISSLFPAQEAVKSNDAVYLHQCLQDIDKSLAAMYQTLERMPEHCDPYIYYHRVRPYIFGWKDHPEIPDGLIYEGVEEYKEKPVSLRGETGAQSSIIPALDAALGIVHESDYMRHYLDEMRDYMPPGHRNFIKAIEQGPSIREFILHSVEHNTPSAKQLHSIYNSCISWMEKFRHKHLEYARDYIFLQAQRSPTNPSAVGTGGTPFMPYLKKHHDETAEHLLT